MSVLKVYAVSPTQYLNSLEGRFIGKRGEYQMAYDLQTVILAVIIGTLAAIVYSLRVLVLMERRVARIDKHIEMMAEKIVVEEKQVFKEEKEIERLVKKKR